MKFRLILEELLNELSGDEIYQKYYNKIPYEDFLAIVSIDNQSKVSDGKVLSVGKYSKLFLRMYQTKNLKMEDLDKAKEYLGYVYHHKIPLDVNKISNLNDLFDIVKGYVVKKTRNIGDAIKALKPEEYDTLHNGEQWTIYLPKTEKASCYLGVGTQWCTTWGSNSLDDTYKGRDNYFGTHNTRGPLYIIINKKNPEEKYQFHFETKQFMDTYDKSVDPKELIKENPELFYYFFPSFNQEVSKEQLELEYGRLVILPSEYRLPLTKKLIGETNNLLAQALIEENEDTVNEIMKCPDIDGDIEISQGRIIFDIYSLDGYVRDVYDTLGNWEYELNNGYEYVLNDFDDEERVEELVKDYLSEFYEERKDTLRLSNVRSFTDFTTAYLHHFTENNDITRATVTECADLCAPNYESEAQSMVDQITETISFDGETKMSLDISSVVKLVIGQNITSFDTSSESGTNFWGFIDDFIENNEVPTDFEYYVNFDWVYPKYSDGGRLSDLYDEFFEKLIENNGECLELRSEFMNIYNQYFDNDYNEHENEHVIITINPKTFNCETNMVQTKYINKENGSVYGSLHGDKSGVKVDNLVNLINNYKLFEVAQRFKNIIK